jgi:transcriptional regulator with XRE-family HTH domain
VLCKKEARMKTDVIPTIELIHQNLGQNLKQRRKSLKLTQEAFAERCGLHRTYIGAIERGERNITLSTLACIAEALKIQPQNLIKVPKT